MLKVSEENTINNLSATVSSKSFPNDFLLLCQEWHSAVLDNFGSRSVFGSNGTSVAP